MPELARGCAMAGAKTCEDVRWLARRCARAGAYLRSRVIVLDKVGNELFECDVLVLLVPDDIVFCEKIVVVEHRELDAGVVAAGIVLAPLADIVHVVVIKSLSP